MTTKTLYHKVLLLVHGVFGVICGTATRRPWRTVASNLVEVRLQQTQYRNLT